PITDRYPFMTVDATYFKIRENHRIISKAFMIAYGTNESGIREVLGFGVYPNESKETWRNFLLDLKNRGLSGLRMVTYDAHESIRYALNQVFPGVAWQRGQIHFSRNIADKAPKKYQAGIRAELQEMFQCRIIEDARKKKAEIISTYGDVAEAAMRCLDEGFESSMTVMVLPLSMQRFFRTSNHIERLNKELKRRSKAIGIFPNEQSLLRLMGSVLMERNEIIQSGKAIFSSSSYCTFMKSEAPGKLVALAEE
ncbi:MAG: transposase, partial [Ruminococcus sp.]|nr:transposase [Ruminococcus sp.]